MKTYVALLRGINVGGHKKVPMAELRDLLTKFGFANVQTYIQSGNVVLQSAIFNISEIESSIQKAIRDNFGFEVSVIVKTNMELKAIFEASPFSTEKINKSYFILLSKIPDSDLLKGVDELSFENEEIIIKNDCLYFYSDVGYGKTKFSMNTCERKLKVSGTARNYNTMVKLLSLSAEQKISMTEQQFITETYTNAVESGKVTWESPSNIALVKYWGKKENQIPENPSISFTLNSCKTITSLSFSKKENTSNFEFEVYLDGEKKDDFKSKIETFFKRVEVYLPFLKQYKFVIETENTFPHSSGIASSASGMSALALCLMSIEKDLSTALEVTDGYFNQKASFLARLGSGSACRSIEGDLIVWGKNDAVDGSSDLFGIKYPYKVHENFKEYQDTILLVDKGEKQVSSTVGHNLMHNHSYAKTRFNQAHGNLEKLKSILEYGDLKAFIALIESEALTLHAMMMTSMPYFILMKPNTLEIINKIWKFREETGLHISFTLDAGANVHVLYPKNESLAILEFIKNELVAYCQNGHYICDQIGLGANKL